MAIPDSSVTLDDATIKAFQTDGVTVVRGAFTAWIEALRTGMDATMATPSPLERSYHPEGSAPFFQDLCNWQRIPQFRNFIENSPAGSVAAQLMQAHEVRFFHDHELVKEPGTTLVTPWHQDSPYYCVTGEKTLSLWIPLDPVTKEQCLECVSGSHHWGVTHRPRRFDGSRLYEDDSMPEMPDIDANRALYAIRSWDLAPGDAIAFDFRTIHGAPATTSNTKRRRVFSARWVGDNARFADRGGKGSPPFPHVSLKDGDLLDGPDFPVIYKVTS
ncbi:phytanoyl-CoA dioxygenase [Acetobacter cibinongensis]|uniref:Phytanoyl-CoA dioxygenase n=1 Tax=Acetobacter cibinongensis TaxID=146475 RepID=A0A0D6N4L1_9PROT|nr:phytanoyl-CoA dioxygenase family protein [Acetobacter cibinongensis]GAN60650.1 phytanoyl-CoA dioxygenase [Acetobacter cibinongensis]GBQ13991.1 phytanoyl-CoA dioxygenase [Acetobacter cibinongensis NRIC 0482]GEL60096.1 phytanoyl-CoA dioxygenase [Acetobacter cibinongensis]